MNYIDALCNSYWTLLDSYIGAARRGAWGRPNREGHRRRRGARGGGAARTVRATADRRRGARGGGLNWSI